MKSKIAPGTSERLPRQILLFSLPLMAFLTWLLYL